MRHILILFFALLGGACSLKNIQQYEGAARPSSEISVVSALGIYHDRNLTLQVQEIDGESVNTTKAASFQLLPGTYRIRIFARANADVGTNNMGQLAYRDDRAVLEVVLEAKPGHTYIPNAVMREGKIGVYFDDVGQNFPRECLPMYREVNTSSNPGFAAYAGGLQCQLPGWVRR
jgi:hypothetical protein